ncbi:MAG: MerR family transcriptional regulator [Chloroflexota bacterium]|nr:MAG: MerR family transcriptional regulator [Chloroflexota bacterium]
MSELSDQGFYLLADASRIARVHQALVSAWSRAGIVTPTVEVATDDGRPERGYTFASVVYLRLLRMLREEHFSLEQAVRALRSLEGRFGPPGGGWADARIVVDKRQLYAYRKDEWGTTVPTQGNQKIADPLFGAQFAAMRARPDELLVPMEFQRFVRIDPTVRGGAPVVIGTTIETGTIYRLSKRLRAVKRVHDYYPHVPEPKIAGAVRYEKFLDAQAA